MVAVALHCHCVGVVVATVVCVFEVAVDGRIKVDGVCQIVYEGCDYPVYKIG